jgi:hypothetical protein
MAHPAGLRAGDRITTMRVLRRCAAPDCDELFEVVLGLRGRGHLRDFCKEACRTWTNNPHGRTGEPRGPRPRNKKAALAHKEETT